MISTLLVTAALACDGQSVDAVLQKHFDAQGGEARLKAVKTMKLVSKTTEGEKSSTAVIQRRRPNQMRYDITKGAESFTKLFDGKKGWIVEGKNAPMAVEGDKLSMMKDKAE